MKLAIKQPYFMPYIGYFQVMKYVDTFVFYDDVNYYKGGYINRNYILINNQSNYIIIPTKNASQNLLINEVVLFKHDKMYQNVAKTIFMAYKKAPYFDKVFPIIEGVLTSNSTYLSELAQLSIVEVAKYLNLKTTFLVSSEQFASSRGIEKEKRLINICKEVNAQKYICDIGGKEIYKKENFKKEGIDLQFLIPNLPTYEQFENKFVPSLSIIDILMFNSINTINEMMDNFVIE